MSRHPACSLILLIGGCLVTQDDVDQWTDDDEDAEEEGDTAGGGSGSDDGTPVSVSGTTGPAEDVTVSVFTASVPENCRSFTDTAVSMDLSHTSLGDLHIELVNPAGESVGLFAPLDWDESATTIRQTFPAQFSDDVSGVGSWTLRIVDSESEDTGNLYSWTLSLTCY